MKKLTSTPQHMQMNQEMTELPAYKPLMDSAVREARLALDTEWKRLLDAHQKFQEERREFLGFKEREIQFHEQAKSESRDENETDTVPIEEEQKPRRRSFFKSPILDIFFTIISSLMPILRCMNVGKTFLAWHHNQVSQLEPVNLTCLSN